MGDFPIVGITLRAPPETSSVGTKKTEKRTPPPPFLRRHFLVKRKIPKKERDARKLAKSQKLERNLAAEVALGDGSIVVMGGHRFQLDFKHAVPKMRSSTNAAVDARRINI